MSILVANKVYRYFWSLDFCRKFKITECIGPYWTWSSTFFIQRLQTFLVRERSALADPYCHSAWMSVGLCVCPQLWGQISRKRKELGDKLLWGAYRKVVRGYQMVTSPMTSRDPMTSYPWPYYMQTLVHHISSSGKPTVAILSHVVGLNAC